MANAPESGQSEISNPENYHGLEPESYTAQRLVGLGLDNFLCFQA